MKKKILALGMAAAMVFSLAACGGGGNETASKDNSKLVIIDSEWYGIDTYQLDSSGGMQGMASTPLFTWDSETNEMVDGVCTDWTVSEDGKTATFNVPEGMYYSTGEQVEPEDIVASIEHGLEVSPYADGYSNITDMSIDGRQITLTLSEFRSDMLYYMCADFMCIIDKDELDSMTTEELMWGSHPYGPYYLASPEDYVSATEVKLTKNEGYKTNNPLVENQGAPYFDEVVIRFNVEDFTAIEDLKAGNVDFICSLSSDQKLELEEVEGVTLINTTYPNIEFFEMNEDSPALSDINVRKAIVLLIDRDALCEPTEGAAVPAYSMIFDTVQNFSQEAKDYFMENLANDPEEGQRLLKEAGWEDTDGDGYLDKDGQILEFTYYTRTDENIIPQGLQNQLGEYGIKVNIESVDWNYIYEYINSDDYDTGIETMAWAEPMLVLNGCWYDQNATGNDDAYYAAVKDAAETIDSEERTKKVGDIQIDIMFKNVNIIPFYSDVTYSAYNEQLQGVVVNNDGTMFVNDFKYE